MSQGIPADAVEAGDTGEGNSAGSAPETNQDGATRSSDEDKETDELAEQTDETDEVSEEAEEVPFHKHPRFQELIRANREFKKQNLELQKKLDALLEKQSSMETAIKAFKESKGDELDPIYVEMIGNDDKAKEFYNFLQKKIEEGVEKRLLDEQKKLQEQEEKLTKQQEYWKQEIDRQLTELEAEGEVFDRDELLKFAKENGSHGYLMDFRVALKLLKQQKQQEMKKKKEQAGKAGTGSERNDKPKFKPIPLDEVSKRSWSYRPY
ncbi:MAG: hypothetical protein D6711_00085 [Chloroflexi bacterium]|nr:MAG: hypothetical protein D6711_00085 [Chloroflexota bacterium]